MNREKKIIAFGRTALPIFLLFALALLVLAAHRPAAAANPAEGPKIKDVNTKEETDRKRVAAILQRIKDLYQEQPPRLDEIAKLYQSIFFIFPAEQQGKVAIWESYHLFRRQGDTTSAMSILRMIYNSYRYDDVMENPFDAKHPIKIHATADIEQAGLYADLMKSPLVAIDQMRSIPDRHAGAYVGIIDGRRTYSGKVETIVRLKMAEAYQQAEQYNAAIAMLREVLEKDRGETVGVEGGARDAEWFAMRRLQPILLAMPASMTKKMVELDEAAKLARSELALAESSFVLAALYESRIKETKNEGDAALAEEEYRKLLRKNFALTYPTPEGIESVGPRAVLGLVRLYTEVVPRPERLLQALEESEAFAHGKPDALATEAYARYYRAVVHFRNLHNARQANILIQDFGDRFASVVVYPFKEKEARMLFEDAKKLEKETAALLD